MHRILTAVGIWLSMASGYATFWTDCSEAFAEKDVHLKAGRVAAKDLTVESKTGKVKLEAGEDKDFYHYYHKSSGLITTSVDDEGHDRTTQKPVEVVAQNVVLPGPAEIDYKAGLGKEFREALAGRPDINWNAVADNYREWSEHTTTLSGPARMLVACVLTAATNGLGSKWFAAHGIAEDTAMNAALSAGIQAVVTGAGTSLAGNLGDIGKTFDELTSGDFVKSLASTMLTAGLSQSLSTSLQLPDEPKTFTDTLKTNAAHGLVHTGVDSAINGGKVGKNLAQTMAISAVDAGAAKIANKIGDGKHSGALNPVAHKALHAGLGAASKALTGGDALAGAIGAAVAETAAEAMDSPEATQAERQKIAQKARLVGDTVAFLAGRDVASADSAGKIALDNNHLSEHLTEIDAQKTMAKLLPEEIAEPYLELLDADEKRTLEAARDPFVQTAALSAVGFGVPLAAKTLTVVGTAATAHYFGSIAVDSGAKGLVKEAKDHPIMTTLAVMPFVPGPKVLKVVKGPTKTLARTEQATQAVQQEFRFVQELQPAKKVETVARETTATTTTAKVVAAETKPVQQKSSFIPLEYRGSVKINGENRDVSRTVYARKDIDFHLKDASGRTNFERMSMGEAPIGSDGKRIELHHLLQEETGTMVELTQTQHRMFSKQLHGLVEKGNSFRNNPTLEKQYEKFRKQWWEWRATQWEKSANK